MAEHQRIEKPPRTVIVRGADRDAIAKALFGETETTPLDVAGRGLVGSFAMSDGDGVLRTCRRGGLVGKLVNEGYLLRNRPLAEFRVHESLYDIGVSVPEPLGVMWEKRLFVFRGAIATRRLEAVGLRQWIENHGAEESTVLTIIGKLIRSMHDAGVYHADLHVENILVEGEKAYLIDFDSASRHTSLSGVQRARNLLRLRRSFQKWCLPMSAYEAILGGYGTITIPSWLDAAYRLKAKASDLVAAS